MNVEDIAKIREKAEKEKELTGEEAYALNEAFKMTELTLVITQNRHRRAVDRMQAAEKRLREVLEQMGA